MIISKELITPLKAAGMLEGNDNNRTINESRVYRYAREMNDGKWMVDTGELIKISEAGRVLDGQHRLLAVIKSKKQIFFHVARGLKDDIFKSIDTGKTRSASDIFKIAGVKSAAQTSSILQLYNNIHINKSKAEKATNTLSLTPQELLEIYNSNPEYWKDLVLFSQSMYQKFQKIWNNSEIGAFTAMLDEIDRNVSRVFIRQICEGVGVDNDVIILLRNILISDKMSVRNKLPVINRRALIIKTWNTFYTNKEIKRLTFVPEKDNYPTLITNK